MVDIAKYNGLAIADIALVNGQDAPVGWSVTATFTIDSTQVASDLTDFVVYLRLSDITDATRWSTLDWGWGIVAYKTDGTTQIPIEVVSYDTTAETGEVHVKYDWTLSSSSDTEIKLTVDWSTATPWVTDTYGRNNVLSDYVYAFPLEESSGTRISSTGSNNAAENGTVGSNTGIVWDGAEFTNNASNYLEVSYVADTIWNGTNDRTLQLWCKSDTTTWVHSMAGRRWDIDQDYLLYRNGSNIVAWWRASGAAVTASSNSSGVRYKLDLVLNSGNPMQLYRNAVSQGTSSPWQTTHWGTQETIIGGNDSLSGVVNPFDWVIDWVRLRSGVLSADWIDAEYTNQNTPTTFYTVT